jgi:putative oxidoreductase
MNRIQRAYAWFLRAANACQSPLLLAIRLYWGWQFWQTGMGKLSHIAKVTDYFTSLRVPAPDFTAYFNALLEVGGGILLALGLGSRVIALLLAGDMIGAYVFGDPEALKSVISDPGKFYNADPFTFMFASLLVLIFGPGWISLDTAIARYRKRRQTANAVAGS